MTNISKALPWIIAHSHVAAFMDNDPAGKETLQKIMESVPDIASTDVCVYDMSKLYQEYNDLNDKLSGVSTSPSK